MKIEESNDFTNKRNYFRVYLNEPICTEVSIVNLNGKSIKTNASCVCVKDIGIGGLRFETKLKLPPGENIVYKFKIQVLHKFHYIRGTIAWMHEEKNGEIYYGIKFLISDQDTSDYFTVFNNLALTIKRNRLNHGCNFCDIEKCPNYCSEVYLSNE